MIFAHPWALVLGPLVLIAWLVRRSKTAAVLFPSRDLLKNVPRSLKLRLRRPVLFFLSLLTLSLLSVAAARPQRISVMAQAKKSRNIMLALDVSRSMSAADVKSGNRRVTRLTAVKSVVASFVKDRPDERLGLVVFGSNAFLQSPLTLDHDLVSQLVQGLHPGMAGDGTAIGDGLGLSIKRSQELEGTSKAIILLTDGVNNSGQVNPLKAAKVAKDLGIRVHTIGIGSYEPLITSLPGGIFSNQMGGQVEFDEATLKKIAELTGGVYYNASSEEGLKKIYDEIDALEKTERDEPEKVVTEELFPFFVYTAFICYLSFIALSQTAFMKVP